MIPEWLSVVLADVSAIQLILWVVAVVAIVGALVKLWPFLKNAVRIVDALVQLPLLTQRVARLQPQISAMQQQIASIHHETHNNDGSSIKDAVGRLETGVAGLYPRLDEQDRRLDALASEDDALWAQWDNTQDPREEEES